jgi:hypothetical protein
MSSSGRATEFMRAWGDGHGKPHTDHAWGGDDCDACTVAAFPDPWDALVYAAGIAWPSMFDLTRVPVDSKAKETPK